MELYEGLKKGSVNSDLLIKFNNSNEEEDNNSNNINKRPSFPLKILCSNASETSHFWKDISCHRQTAHLFTYAAKIDTVWQAYAFTNSLHVHMQITTYIDPYKMQLILCKSEKKTKLLRRMHNTSSA